MILLTPYEAFKDLIKSDQLDPSNITVFNLNSSVEGFEPIRILPPDPRIYDPNGAELIKDGILLDFIFSNDSVFFEFFGKVIYPFYSGVDVVLLVSNSFPFINISEAIMKIIQGRYGYNCIYINEASDFESQYFDDNVDINGIFNLDNDKIRYASMSAAKYGVPTDVDNLHFEDHSDSALRY